MHLTRLQVANPIECKVGTNLRKSRSKQESLAFVRWIQGDSTGGERQADLPENRLDNSQMFDFHASKTI